MELIRVSPQSAAEGVRDSVVALGFFDGVHIGHRRLLAAAVEKARACGALPAVFTFSDDARGMKRGAARLTDFETKLSLLAEAGIERTYVADFREVSDLSPKAFVSEILLRRCGARAAVCGLNFRFGRGAAGDAAQLSSLMRQHGREAVTVPIALLGREAISSSAIRAAVEAGDMPRAAAMLGRPFSLTAPVSRGRGFGRTEGIPTVNQALREGAPCPRRGAYAARARLRNGACFAAVANIGACPTFGEAGGKVHCETHLIDYEGDELYGETVTVELLAYLRAEQKFGSVGALYEQIRSDVETARRLAERK